MTMRPLNPLAAILSGLLLLACGRDRAGAGPGDTTPAGETMGAMAGMAMGDTAMVASMQAHMRMMEGVSADSMRAMLPMHRQMLGAMLSQFEQEMRRMNMKMDPAWNALTDSLRQDGTRLADMDASQLAAFMPQHHARVTRLIELHHSMMANMRM